LKKENQHSAIQTKKEQPFGGFFQKIRVRQPIGRKDSIQTMIPTSRRMDLFLYEAAQNFEIFSNIKNKLKNQKPIAVDDLFKAYPKVPLSCRSNLAGRYLYKGSSFHAKIFYIQADHTKILDVFYLMLIISIWN
jgi:hypothetical protein